MVLCDGENIADFSTLFYIFKKYIILFENTYIFIIYHKTWNYSMVKKIIVTFWECTFVVN